MRLSLHLLRDLTVIAVLAAVAIGASGCGKTAAKTKTSAHVRAVKPTAAYRVGQYCFPVREAKYHAAGLACRKHHLMRG